MKKLFALASLLVVLSVTAQERPEGTRAQKENRMDNSKDVKKQRKERPTIDEQMKRYDSYNLSANQKQQVKSLLEKRDADMKTERTNSKNELSKVKEDRKKEFENKRADFDKKLEKIMDKKQYSQYQQDREAKSKKFSTRKNSDSKEFKKSRKTV